MGERRLQQLCLSHGRPGDLDRPASLPYCPPSPPPYRHCTAGKYVDLKDTIADFKGVLDGKYDDLPEMAFYMVRALGGCGWLGSVGVVGGWVGALAGPCTWCVCALGRAAVAAVGAGGGGGEVDMRWGGVGV